MIKQLVIDFFKEIENIEYKKNKNSKASFWYIELQEKLGIQYGDENHIGIRKATRLYEKYVEEKDKSVKDPNKFQRNYMAQYLNFENYDDYKKSIDSNIPIQAPKLSDIKKTKIANDDDSEILTPSRKWYKKYAKVIIPFISFIMLLVFGSYIYLNNYAMDSNCILWKVDHYEKTSCTNEDAIKNSLYYIDIKRFKKVTLTKGMEFFTNGKPNYWYGKNKQGKREFFSIRGIHPITFKELKPITRTILKNENLLDE